MSYRKASVWCTDRPGRFQPRRALALVLVCGQLGLAAAGCVSVRTTTTRPAEGTGGGVSVQVFADDSARRAGHVGPSGLLGELERKQGAGWLPVFRSLNPSWAVMGLPAGTYRMSFPARLTEAGDVERLSRPAERVIRVREGLVTDVRVTLDHVPAALVAVGVVTVVVAAVLISKYLNDHDLPVPPLPPPELVELVFHVSLDLAMNAAWSEVSDRRPPMVTSHFPAAGALVAARRPKVVFCFSEPLQARELKTDAVTVLGEESGLVRGVVSYDSNHWWVVWTPAEELRAGDTFHVTLGSDAVGDLAGNTPGKRTSFSFTTAR